MLGAKAGERIPGPARNALAGGVVAIGFATVAVIMVSAQRDRVNGLTGILAVAAVLAGFLTVGTSGESGISASFIVCLLAAALLGPLSAAAAALLSEVAAAGRFKTPIRKVLVANLPANVLPAIVAALLIGVLSSHPVDAAGFYVVVALAGITEFILSFAIFWALRPLGNPGAERLPLRLLIEDLPSAALSIALTLAGVSITLEVGHRGIAFALAAVFAFSYMAHLLAQSRRRAQQYVSLSWGVLAGLMRSLDIRDQRAARHAAAVARFARDISEAVGMSTQEQELAHTAGLLHDIGNFALSDRVAERGPTLKDDDWEAIQRHPELGADMLKDLGIYGPVAEIVLAHHERIDGRGYPNGLFGDEIPEIAKIIAVAEVYDTLTASDTYRTRMSSFEALRELRRVADSQLDAAYVEVLAGLLSGTRVEYRHADSADFDTERDMERRIREAGTG